MSPRTRRSYLAALGATAAVLAGCIGDSDPPGSTDTSPRRTTATSTSTATPPSSPSASPTPTTERLHLRVVDDATQSNAPLSVYPARLREWLRRAARSGDTLRVHDRASVYTPKPLLPTFDYVRLETPDGDVGGLYEVTADGGARYRLLVGVEETPSTPENATVTPIADLPPERRDLAERAIRGDPEARVYPETELGAWVRHEFFGGYFSADGTTYRGREVQQTDAAFFSTEAWYVLSLSPATTSEASNPVTLRLSDVDPTVSRIIDGLLEDRTKGEPSATYETDELPEAVVRFAGTTDRMMTHTEVFAVTVQRGAGEP